MKNTLLFFIFTTTILLAGCSPDEDSYRATIPEHLNPITSVSLDEKSSSNTITVSRDISLATARTKSNSFWITNISVSQDRLSFSVLENIYTEAGYRSDSIIIEEDGYRIGAFAVYQARPRVSPTKLEWALPNAKYYNVTAPGDGGLAFAMSIITQDDYHLYPALAYCLDMNHDLNSIEWYLPSDRSEVPDTYWDTLLEHGYWWSSSNYNDLAHPFSRTSGSRAFLKGAKLSVIAARTAS